MRWFIVLNNDDMKDTETLKKNVIEQLKKVFDPEIPINIWDMGLIYDIKIDPERNVLVVMTMTAPNCPVAENMPEFVKSEIKSGVPEINNVEVQVTFDPPWDINRLSEEAKVTLGLDFSEFDLG